MLYKKNSEKKNYFKIFGIKVFVLKLTVLERLKEVSNKLDVQPMLVERKQNKKLKMQQRRFQLKLLKNFQQFFFVSPEYSEYRFQYILSFLPSSLESGMWFSLSAIKKVFRTKEI